MKYHIVSIKEFSLNFCPLGNNCLVQVVALSTCCFCTTPHSILKIKRVCTLWTKVFSPTFYFQRVFLALKICGMYLQHFFSSDKCYCGTMSDQVSFIIFSNICNVWKECFLEMHAQYFEISPDLGRLGKWIWSNNSHLKILFMYLKIYLKRWHVDFQLEVLFQ